MIRCIVSIWFFFLVFVTPLQSSAQWVSEQTIATSNLYSPPSLQTSPKVSCANFATAKIISCVYPYYNGATRRLDIFEITSMDGGVSWGSPAAITNDAGDEYDPMIEYDSGRNRLNLVYAKWPNNIGANHNDVVIRYKTSATGTWSGATLVAGDGANDYWIPSVLTLQNGMINVYLTRNGPESVGAAAGSGVGSGRIMVSRSTDGGNTFTAPQIITNTCDAEYPRGVQNSFGGIMLTFSRYIVNKQSGTTPCADGSLNGWSTTDIHQIWSNDHGVTWTGESILYSNSNGSAMHPYVAAQTTQRQTACPSCQWSLIFHGNTSNSFAVFEMTSTNQGLTWQAPTLLSAMVWDHPVDMDGGFIIGCRGFFSFYTDAYPGQNLYSKRYNWSNTCSIQ